MTSRTIIPKIRDSKVMTVHHRRISLWLVTLVVAILLSINLRSISDYRSGFQEGLEGIAMENRKIPNGYSPYYYMGWDHGVYFLNRMVEDEIAKTSNQNGE